MRAIEIPLYLLPQAIALLIRVRGVKVYRISVKRTHLHHYNVSVRTRLLPRELGAGEKFPTPVSESAGNGGDGSCDESGGIA